MKAGIFAAGIGSRFRQAGWKEPKPLIKLNGKPMIAHILDNLFQSGVEEVGILLNEEPPFDPVEEYLLQRPEASKIQIWRKTTQSSFESFCYVMDRLKKAPYLLTTVDAILQQTELQDLLCLETYPSHCDLVLAVTDFVHDEKPLWVEVTKENKIKCIGESVSSKKYITAGLYLITKDLPLPAPGKTFPALRNFLQYFAEKNGTVWAKKLHKVLDIDCPDDIRLGENLLKEIKEK